LGSGRRCEPAASSSSTRAQPLGNQGGRAAIGHDAVAALEHFPTKRNCLGGSSARQTKS
jgi:hypothetical protein